MAGQGCVEGCRQQRHREKTSKIIQHTNGTPYPANAVCEQCGNVRCWPTCLEPTSTDLECCGIKL